MVSAENSRGEVFVYELRRLVAIFSGLIFMLLGGGMAFGHPGAIFAVGLWLTITMSASFIADTIREK